jgi:hypothetical protein
MTSADAERIATQHLADKDFKVSSLRNVIFIDSNEKYRPSFMKHDPYYLVVYNFDCIFDDDGLCVIVNGRTGEAHVYETL